jgi:hypothetical protein
MNSDSLDRIDNAINSIKQEMVWYNKNTFASKLYDNQNEILVNQSKIIVNQSKIIDVLGDILVELKKKNSSC